MAKLEPTDAQIRRRLRSFEELDAAICACDEEGANRGKLISDIYFLPDLSRLELLDPFSSEYRNEIGAIFSSVRGDTYHVGFESNTMDSDILEPGPYNSRHPHLIGDHIGGIATIVKNIEILPPARIMDIGAGWGNTSLLLARCGFDVDAIDINDRFIEVMAHWADRVHVSERMTPIKLEFDQIKSLDHEYDGVLFFESFHHCLNHFELLVVLFEKLKHNGLIVFAGEPIYDWWKLPWALRHEEGLATYCIRRFGWLELGFSENYFIELLERAGFYAERRTYVDYPVANGYLARKATDYIPLSKLLIRSPYADGWNEPDTGGRFTKGSGGGSLPMALFSKMKRMVVKLWNHGPKTIRISLFADSVKLVADDIPASSYHELTAEVLHKAKDFRIESASWSPFDLGLSSDNRMLGVYVVAICKADTE